MDAGLRILAEAKRPIGVPVPTDVHEDTPLDEVAEPATTTWKRPLAEPAPRPAPHLARRRHRLAGLLAMCALWSVAALGQAPPAGAGAGAGAPPPAPPSAADIAPLDGDEWNRFAVAIDTLRMCVEATRAGRPPAQTVATLQALDLAAQIRGQALLLLPRDDPARAAVEAATDDAQAIMRSFQAMSAWQPVRPLDQALALAYVYHFEAQATQGACLPTNDFVSNYQKALTR